MHLFHPIIGQPFDNHTGQGGRTDRGVILTTRMRVLPPLCGLSNPELERQANDRISFRKFPGFPEKIPDHFPLWHVREHPFIPMLMTTSASLHDGQAGLSRKDETVCRNNGYFGVQPRASRDETVHRSTGGHPLLMKEEPEKEGDHAGQGTRGTTFCRDEESI